MAQATLSSGTRSHLVHGDSGSTPVSHAPESRHHTPSALRVAHKTVVSDRCAQWSVGAGAGSCYQDREQQGCCARAPHGWVHGRVLVVTTGTSALPESEAENCYDKPA